MAASPNFSFYDPIYAKLGSKVENIDVTSLKLALEGLQLLKNGSIVATLVSADYDLLCPQADFTSPIELTFEGTIETGAYDGVYLQFIFGGVARAPGYTDSEITFKWPADMNFSSHYLSSSPKNGDFVTAKADSFEIATQEPFPKTAKNNAFQFLLFAAGAEYQMLENVQGNEITLGDIFPYSANADQEFKDGDPWPKNFLVVPRAAITIPGNATSVTFEVSWNLQGLLERYDNNTANPDDDIFVLKNGWWEEFSLKAIY